MHVFIKIMGGGMYFKSKVSFESIQVLLFSFVIFFLTRQVPLNSYSTIMNIALLIFFFCNIKYLVFNFSKYNELSISIAVGLMYLLLMIIYSLYLLNEIPHIIRFSLILFLIQIAYFLKPNYRYIEIFILFLSIQALFIIGFELYLILNYDLKNYMPIRYFFREQGWGDVYTYDGVLWKIQIKGTALLTFGFFVIIIYYNGIKKYILASIFLLSILFAGNFAYILGVLFFSSLYYLFSRRWTVRKMVLDMVSIFILTLIFSIPVFNYLMEVIEMKSEMSNKVRADQVEILISDLNENNRTIIFGKGLGNTVNIKTKWRDYSDQVYYELQSVYILNQVGCMFFIYFIIINIILAFFFIRYKILLICYGSYLFYSIFNPYFFDTNHIVVIIILLSLRKVMDEKSILHTCSIQPTSR